jgi:hypothetical protein
MHQSWNSTPIDAGSPRRTPSSAKSFAPPRPASRDQHGADPSSSAPAFVTQNIKVQSLSARSPQTPSTTPSKPDRRYPPSAAANFADLGNQSRYPQAQGLSRKASVRSISETPLDAPVRHGPLIFAAMAEEPEPPMLSGPPTGHSPAEYNENVPSTPYQNAAALYASAFPNTSDSQLGGQASPVTPASPPPQSRGFQQQQQPISQPQPRKLSKVNSINFSNRPLAEPPQAPLRSSMSTSYPHSQMNVNDARENMPSESYSNDHTSNGHRVLGKPRQSVTPSPRKSPAAMGSDYKPVRNYGLNTIDGDPFAKAKVMVRPSSKDGLAPKDDLQWNPNSRDRMPKNDLPVNGNARSRHNPVDGMTNDVLRKERKNSTRHLPTPVFAVAPGYRQLPTPFAANIIPPQQSRRTRPDNVPPLFFYLADPELLSSLLSFLTFFDWCTLWSTSKYIRTLLGDDTDLREVVLERYLQTVGYRRWIWEGLDPLALSLKVCV